MPHLLIAIIAGTWCHICGKKKSDDSKRGSIEEMMKIAKKRYEVKEDYYVWYKN
tara:strand:- start:288 stop:449 length:162 start_codon:yes stop_codon:yes gene_type:complete